MASPGVRWLLGASPGVTRHTEVTLPQGASLDRSCPGHRSGPLGPIDGASGTPVSRHTWPRDLRISTNGLKAYGPI